MDDLYKDCTEACERVVRCVVCGRKKPPVGRDVASAWNGSYCARECEGYAMDPIGGHLWPGELAQIRELDATAQETP